MLNGMEPAKANVPERNMFGMLLYEEPSTNNKFRLFIHNLYRFSTLKITNYGYNFLACSSDNATIHSFILASSLLIWKNLH